MNVFVIRLHLDFIGYITTTYLLNRLTIKLEVSHAIQNYVEGMW